MMSSSKINIFSYLFLIASSKILSIVIRIPLSPSDNLLEYLQLIYLQSVICSLTFFFPLKPLNILIIFLSESVNVLLI